MAAVYQVVLENADRSLTYESGEIRVNNDSEVLQNAIEWTKQFRPFSEDCYLLVTQGHRGVARLKPGEF